MEDVPRGYRQVVSRPYCPLGCPGNGWLPVPGEFACPGDGRHHSEEIRLEFLKVRGGGFIVGRIQSARAALGAGKGVTMEWDEPLGERVFVITVKAITKKNDGFLVITGEDGKVHRVHPYEFTPWGRAHLKVGARIRVLITERFLLPEVIAPDGEVSPESGHILPRGGGGNSRGGADPAP